jgi:NADPH:quinone reductase-like Zn-dependent oxidoreductase
MQTHIEIPTHMKALRLHAAGEPSSLVLEEIPVPQPRKGEVLVRVHAAAITRGELEWPSDRLPAIPSYEFSGVVAALGAQVKGIAVGDPVYALSSFSRDGAAAEYLAVTAEHLAPKPERIGYPESAAVPLAGLSAWQGLYDHGRLAAGEQVLIHGAAGGVGSYAVQFARYAGASVIGTASTGHLDLVRALGADRVIDHTAERFETAVEPVDLVFDTAGGERLAASPAVLRPGGRLVSVAEQPPQEEAARRGIEAVYFIVKPRRDQLLEIGELIDAGKLRPLIAEIYPLAEGRRAFERSLERGHAGKIVLATTAHELPTEK